MVKKEDKKDMSTEEEAVDKTVVTKIEKLERPSEREAYILFMSGPLQGKLHCLAQDKTVIGRDDAVDIQIKDIRISRQHFQINLSEGQAVLEDLGSTNGTYVNGQRVKLHTLQDGDKIQIPASVVIKFAYGDKGEQMFHEEFYHMANFDAVTGAFSRHYFMKRLEEEFSYAKRTKIPLSFLMIDIDFFKKVNDKFGHLAGDLALSHTAKQIKETIRHEDILGRYGGEEFAVILRGIDEKGSMLLAERIRQRIEKNPMKFETENISITVSIGSTTMSGDNYEATKEIIDDADQCLYTAKEGGRNRVVGKTVTRGS